MEFTMTHLLLYIHLMASLDHGGRIRLSCCFGKQTILMIVYDPQKTGAVEIKSESVHDQNVLQGINPQAGLSIIATGPEISLFHFFSLSL